MNLDEIMESAILIAYEIKDPNFKNLVDYVLTRIPDSDFEDSPSFSIYEAPSKWVAHVDEDNVYFDVEKAIKKSEGNKEVLIGFIAHELAHAILQHATKKEREAFEHEYEADNLGVEWGFENEIKAFRQNFGPPTVEDSQETK